MKCYICGNQKLTIFLDLGHQAPSDAFLTHTQLDAPEVTYPLALAWCSTCTLVQLNYSVDPGELFSSYVYTTGSNNSLRAHFAELASTLIQRFNLRPTDLTIDIGSNDGTLLQNYRTHGVQILGIDPSSVARSAKKAGIPTVVDFFNEKVAQKVRSLHGQAKVITASNVFAHVPELNSFVRGVKKLLTPDGVFVSESHYLLDILEKNQYDSVYHEHLRYYSLNALQILFKRHGLEIFDVERMNMHNGSIRVYTARPGIYKKTTTLTKLLALEKQKKINTLNELKRFSARVQKHRQELLSLIVQLKKKGAQVVGIGAPAKGNTVLQACRLGPELIDYLAEKSELKIGRFSPGVHIPVVPDTSIIQDQPEYALVLSWNITAELVKKIRTLGYKGIFIVPFPKPYLIKK